MLSSLFSQWHLRCNLSRLRFAAQSATGGVGGNSMTHAVSRRQFLTSAISLAAASSLTGASAFPLNTAHSPQSAIETALQSSDWKSQGIENLAKSPHAKLRQVPIRAVTINDGFWGKRRE